MKRLLFPLAMLALTACQPEPNVTLRIDCGPYNDQGVAIQLNGQDVGECPLDIMTLAGQTEVEIHKLFSDSGFIQERQTLQLAENVNKRVIFQPKLQYPERHYKAKREKIILIAGRWYDNLDGTITDRETGLTWMRCSMGQKWNGRGCGGNVKGYTWSEANLAGQGVDFAGHQDWRLPTVRELFTLVVCSSGKVGNYTIDLKDGHAALKHGCLGSYTRPTLDTQAFPNTQDAYFWSSSAVAGNSDGAWYVGFGNGYADWSYRDFSLQLRLVRSGQ